MAPQRLVPVAVCIAAITTSCFGLSEDPSASPNVDIALAYEFNCKHSNAGSSDPNDLRKRRVVISDFDPVKVGDPIDWGHDGHHSWEFRFHNLMWLLPYFDEGVDEEIKKVLRDWINNNPVDDPPSEWSWGDHATALRAKVLACATRLFGDAHWLMEAMEQHAEVLADEAFYRGQGNHALNQNVGLHRIGCVLGRRDWMGLAEERFDALAVDSIDEQGVTNEGAVQYQKYNYTRYQEAINQIQACKRSLPAGLERARLMPRMLAYATRPDGRYEQIGDSRLNQAVNVAPGTVAEYAATQSESGPRPRDRVAVFDAGYVFGRSGWGADRSFERETFYSVRFGPGDVYKFHGHADHTAVTWHPNGVPVLVDGGWSGYERSAYRWDYIKAMAGHNVVRARDSEFLSKRGTSLDKAEVHRGWEVYELSGKPYRNVARQRSVLIHHDPQLLAVLDTLRGDGSRRYYEQMWQLHPGLNVVMQGGATARITSENISVTMRQLGGGQITVLEGEEDPYQGWVSFDVDHREPAPAIVTSKPLTGTRFLTVFAVGDEVTATKQDGQVTVDVDGHSVTFDVETLQPDR